MTLSQRVGLVWMMVGLFCAGLTVLKGEYPCITVIGLVLFLVGFIIFVWEGEDD